MIKLECKIKGRVPELGFNKQHGWYISSRLEENEFSYLIFDATWNSCCPKFFRTIEEAILFADMYREMEQ